MVFPRFDLLFCPKKKLYSLLGGTSSDLGRHSLKMPARGIGSATFLWSTIFAWGVHFFLGGHKRCFGDIRPRNAPLWRQAYIKGLVTIVDIVSIVDLADIVDIGGLVDMVSKYSRHSRQGRHSLAWDNKTLTQLRRLEQPVFHFVYIAFTIKKASRLNNRFCNWPLEVVPEVHYKQIYKFLSK